MHCYPEAQTVNDKTTKCDRSTSTFRVFCIGWHRFQILLSFSMAPAIIVCAPISRECVSERCWCFGARRQTYQRSYVGCSVWHAIRLFGMVLVCWSGSLQRPPSDGQLIYGKLYARMWRTVRMRLQQVNAADAERLKTCVIRSIETKSKPLFFLPPRLSHNNKAFLIAPFGGLFMNLRFPSRRI